MSPSKLGNDGPELQATSLERTVIDAMRAAVPNTSLQITPASAVLDLVDSLGLVMTLGNLQAALGIELAPKQVIELFRAASIADVAAVIERFLGASHQAAEPPQPLHTSNSSAAMR